MSALRHLQIYIYIFLLFTIVESPLRFFNPLRKYISFILEPNQYYHDGRSPSRHKYLIEFLSLEGALMQHLLKELFPLRR